MYLWTAITIGLEAVASLGLVSPSVEIHGVTPWISSLTMQNPY